MNIDVKYIPVSVSPKQESDTERDLQIVKSNLVACKTNITTLKERLTQLQLVSVAKENLMSN